MTMQLDYVTHCPNCRARVALKDGRCVKCGSGLARPESKDEVDHLPVAGSAAIIMGCLMPWVHVPLGNVTGITFDEGKVVLALGIVAAVSSYQMMRKPAAEVPTLALLGVGLLAAVLSLYAYVELQSHASTLVQVRFGMFVTLVGSGLVSLAGLRARKGHASNRALQRRRPDPHPQSRVSDPQTRYADHLSQSQLDLGNWLFYGLTGSLLAAVVIAGVVLLVDTLR